MKGTRMTKLNWDTFMWPSLILAPALTWLVLQLVWGGRPVDERVMYGVCGTDLVVAVVYGAYSRWRLTRKPRREFRDEGR